ncbi:MAG TPA: cupin domain-containing protein [Gemmatimonadales bacterium]|nr:cupin domain-containing protein [Gemmatimonadales bacterium]
MDAEAVVRRLGLMPHPEGGFYRETFRSPLTLDLPDGRRRAASTAIHYLLPAGARSTWHRLASDEVWHHYGGGALHLHLLGTGTRRLDRGEPQVVVPAGVWQAAEPEDDAVLCGCTVAPGFDFADFELGREKSLVAAYPDQEALIRRLLQ